MLIAGAKDAIGSWKIIEIAPPRTIIISEVFFSDKFQTMIGYEPGELPALYDTWSNLLHPDDRTAVLESFARGLTLAN